MLLASRMPERDLSATTPQHFSDNGVSAVIEKYFLHSAASASLRHKSTSELRHYRNSFQLAIRKIDGRGVRVPDFLHPCGVT